CARSRDYYGSSPDYW
nr:immunoglobulin heavy chain junction region [Mus musculus]